MKALTIWQPWAELIMAGAKPYEFRCWPAPRSVRGQRIVIHAGARPVRRAELRDALWKLDHDPAAVSLEAAIARPLLEAALRGGRMLTTAAGLGTARLGTPIRCTDLFPGDENADPKAWAWPLTEIEAFAAPIAASGAQGFWDWRAAA